MKQAIECTCRPFVLGWFARLLAPFGARRDAHHKGRADRLSSHMLRDIGLSDEARGDPLYGGTRRRW